MDFFNCFKVVLFCGELIILKQNLLGSQVLRKDGSICLTCELGPISEFEIIGDF